MAQLLKSTMRLRPDRIIVGEVRDGAALTLLKAWNTGHPGGVATIHSNTAQSALRRLEQLTAEVSRQPVQAVIGEAVDLIISIDRTPKGRRVSDILRVHARSQSRAHARPYVPGTFAVVVAQARGWGLLRGWCAGYLISSPMAIMDPDRVVLCEPLNEDICFATWYAVRRAPLVGDRPAKPVEMFRQHDQVGSADHSLAHQPRGFGKIIGPIGLRTHLNEGDFQDLGSSSKSKIDRPEAK